MFPFNDVTLDVNSPWEQDIALLYLEAFELIARKQRDYGPGNIESFGEAGVIVRLYDKLARLRNLMSTGKEASTDSIEDTWMDIVNYGIIGLSLQRRVAFYPKKRYRIVEVEGDE